MIQATVTLKLDGLERFKQKLDGSPPITAALKQWGARYRGFVQRRFDKYSKGGGDWAPLSKRTLLARRGAPRLTSFRKKKFAKVLGPRRAGQSTKARRKASGRLKEQARKHNAREATRKVKHNEGNTKKLKAFKVAILRDTGLLFAALNPTLTVGGQERVSGLSVTVGYGGPGRHGKSGKSIADIASFHNLGAGHLPRRRIIVEPSPEVLKQMAGDMDRALKKLADEVSK